MRRQIYVWNHRPDGFSGAQAARGGPRPPNTQDSVFVGAFGTAVTVPAVTSPTQFVVIEHIASSPGDSGPTAPAAPDPLALPGNKPTQEVARVDDGLILAGNPQILGADGAGDLILATTFPYVPGTLEAYFFDPMAPTIAPFNAAFNRMGVQPLGPPFGPAPALGTEVSEITTIVGGPMAGLTTGPNSSVAFVPFGAPAVGGTFHASIASVLGSPVAGGESFMLAYVSQTTQVQAGGGVQMRVNTTGYYLTPDGVVDPRGVPGDASPYPASVVTSQMYFLRPDMYILPGQTWDLLYTTRNAVGVDPQQSALQTEVFCRYVLYDGPDSLIANRLLEMGITVTPDNVDWYKRLLVEQQNKQEAAASAQ